MLMPNGEFGDLASFDPIPLPVNPTIEVVGINYGEYSVRVLAVLIFIFQRKMLHYSKRRMYSRIIFSHDR